MNTRGKKLQIVQRSMYDVNAKICRLVSQNPCLFDRSDPNFQKQNVVQDVWKHIGEEMNLLAKTCQQRWVNMRATYIRSLRGHPEGSTYYLTNDIQFLYEHITPLPPKARRSRVSGLEEDRKPKVEAKPKVWHAQSPNGDEPEYVGTSFEEDSKYGTARKILRLSQDDKENVQSSISNRYSERVLDFDEAFLQGIRPEINKMNFTQKLHFKRGVYDLLGEIFAPEMATPRASGGSSKVANEYEIASEPSISSPMTPIGQQLQLPKPTSILKKNVSFRL